jgi:hypothetical protein
MLLHKNKLANVGSLDEDLKDIGIDSDKFLGRVHHMTGLMEERSGKNGGWKGTPPVAQYGMGPKNSSHVTEERSFRNDDEDAEQLDEAFVIKQGLRGGAKRAAERKSKKARLKDPAAYARSKALGRRSSVKKARKRTEKKKKRTFSASRMKALHRAGKRISKSFGGEPDEVDEQRRSAAIEAALAEDTQYQAALAEYEDSKVADSPFFDAACNVEEIAIRFEEIFDTIGENEAAKVMEALGEHAATLAKELEGVTDLSEDQDTQLKDILAQAAKGIRFYESKGEPSLKEACAYRLHMESLSEDEDDDDLAEVGDQGNDEELAEV